MARTASNKKSLSPATSIAKVFNYEYVPGEDVQSYLHSVVDLINNATEEEWSNLSPEAQNWYNEQVEMLDKFNTKEEIEAVELTLIPGLQMELPTLSEPKVRVVKSKKNVEPVVEQENETSSETEELSLEEATEASVQVKAPAKVAKPKVTLNIVKNEADTTTTTRQRKSKTEKTVKEAGSKTVHQRNRLEGEITKTVTDQVIRLMCENIDLSNEELLEQVTAMGIETNKTFVATFSNLCAKVFKVMNVLGTVKNSAGVTLFTRV